MKKIKLDGYETEDGRQFMNDSEARDHELRCVLDKILERHYTYDMSKSMIIDAIIESRAALLKALTDE